MLKLAGIGENGALSADDDAVDSVLMAVAVLDAEVAVQSSLEITKHRCQLLISRMCKVQGRPT